jgi:5-methylthioribose kinase
MRWDGQTAAARKGEPMNLDVEDFAALRDYLARRVKGHEPVSFQKLDGGVSNRTVKVVWSDGRSWVLKQALEKLRVTTDWFSSPERILVKAKALRCFNRLTSQGTTPAFLFQDDENYLMVMEAVPEPHENWKLLVLSGQIFAEHFEKFGTLLGTIHRKSSQPGVEEREEFADTRYFESLRLEPYYLYAGRRTPAAAPFLNALAEEVLRHKISLVHGDFSPKNTLIHQGRLVLLDYEVVHFGDPAFDVGFALAHFLSKAHHLAEYRAHLACASMSFWRTVLRSFRSAGRVWLSNGLSKIPLAVSLHVRLESRR